MMSSSERALEIKQINERLAGVRGSARSADGSVAIETDVGGRITSLYLADYAMENGPDRLAVLIVDRHRAALAEAEAEASRIFDTPEYGTAAGSGHSRDGYYEAPHRDRFEWGGR
ncbi:YbaB/EbfC family nucleoid-associated protein [Nocardia sp. BMG51109]|uniref:YbaB/EbfC family nucleoid-associated protein n=1 Tax=Nocardia sp. BMG51109 TaxID=1056816 RepID=UPI00046575CB|nr:YbaB/EbfC family nucleoid-associated protein [Nocardia sp. BMG51109]